MIVKAPTWDTATKPNHEYVHPAPCDIVHLLQAVGGGPAQGLWKESARLPRCGAFFVNLYVISIASAFIDIGFLRGGTQPDSVRILEKDPRQFSPVTSVKISIDRSRSLRSKWMTAADRYSGARS